MECQFHKSQQLQMIRGWEKKKPPSIEGFNTTDVDQKVKMGRNGAGEENLHPSQSHPEKKKHDQSEVQG